MPRLISESLISEMSAENQLELANGHTGTSAFDRVQLGSCLLSMHIARSYKALGCRSVLYLGFDLEPAPLRQCMRAAFWLRHLPETRNAVESGDLDWDRLTSILRIARPVDEAFWLDQARTLGSPVLERRVRREIKKVRMVEHEEWLEIESQLPLIQFDDDLEQAFCESFPPPLSDHDCILLFGLLHNCSVEYGGVLWAPTTQRGAAHLLASTWRGSDVDRSDYCFWYHMWARMPVAFTELVGPDIARLNQLRIQLESHPLIGSVVPEECRVVNSPDGWPRADPEGPTRGKVKAEE